MVLGTFSEKMVPLLGDDGRALHLFTKRMDPSRCICAIDRETLVGIVAISTVDGAMINIHLRDVLKAYGFFSGLWRIMGLALFDHQSAAGECYIECIAVVPDMRGRGIGSVMMARLEGRAKLEGMRRLTLAVIETNPKALSLYRRLGFIETRTISIWPADSIFHLPFRKVSFMEKQLTDGD